MSYRISSHGVTGYTLAEDMKLLTAEQVLDDLRELVLSRAIISDFQQATRAKPLTLEQFNKMTNEYLASIPEGTADEYYMTPYEAAEIGIDGLRDFLFKADADKAERRKQWEALNKEFGTDSK